MTETNFEFDETIEQGAIIHIIGCGITGLRAVGKMSGRIHGVECIGVRLESKGCADTTALPMVILSQPDFGSTINPEPLLKIIDNSDLIFIVSNLNEGLDDLVLEVCSAIRRRSVPIIIVMPEPKDAKGRSIPLPEQVVTLRAFVDGLILISGSSLTPLYHNSPKVFNDTTLLDYILRHSIEKATDIVTTRSLMCVDLADVLTIMRGNGVIRIGVGIASGTDKGVSATNKAFYALKQQGILSLAKVTRLLCCITGSGEMTMEDYNDVNKLLHAATNEDANIKIAVTHNDEMGNILMVTIWAVVIDHNY